MIGKYSQDCTRFVREIEPAFCLAPKLFLDSEIRCMVLVRATNKVSANVFTPLDHSVLGNSGKRTGSVDAED